MRQLWLAVLLLPALAGAQTVVSPKDLYDTGQVAMGRIFLPEQVCQPGTCGCKRQWAMQMPTRYEHSDVFLSFYSISERGAPGSSIRRMTVSVEREHYDRTTGMLTFSTDANLEATSGNPIEFGMEVTAVLTTRDSGALIREQFNCEGSTKAGCTTTDYFPGTRMWQTPLTYQPLQFLGFAARRIDVNLPNEAYVQPEAVSFDLTSYNASTSGAGDINFTCSLMDSSADEHMQCSVDVVGIALASGSQYWEGGGWTAPGGYVDFIPGPADNAIYGVAKVNTVSGSGPMKFERHAGGCIRQIGSPNHMYVAQLDPAWSLPVFGETQCLIVSP